VKVLYLIDSMASGGAQRQLVTLLSALDRQVVEPHVAVYYPHDHFRAEVDRLGVPVHVLGSVGARDPRVVLRLRRLLRDGGFDVLHSYLRTPGVLARAATLARSRPKVVVSHRSVDLGHSAFRLLLERTLAARADAFIANAEAVRRCLEALVPASRGRVHVVPNGIAWSEPTPGLLEEAGRLRAEWAAGESDVLLAVVGRVERPKDPHLLLDALVGLPADDRDRLSVVWVGAWTDPTLAASVGGRLASLREKPRFRLVGPRSPVRSVYLAADGIVLPSDWEGFPNVVLEAQAEGVPVIATDVGDVRAIVEDGVTGWIVPAGDAAALGRALLALLGAPAARRWEMGRRGAAVRDRYSADRLVAGTMDVYRRVLGRAAGAE
jgi:glycosyltransferase involved in cell wall biosynthesis